jgi:hypothetical protein
VARSLADHEPAASSRSVTACADNSALRKLSSMDPIKNILFFVVLAAIICAIILFEIRSERGRFFEPAPSSPRLHQF